MEEKMIKTSWWQRIMILIIAFLLLGSTIAVYMGIVLSGNSSNSEEDNPELAALQEEYTAKQAELDAAATELAKQYFDEFSAYKSQVKSYNAATANTDGLTTTDLKIGDGRELKEGDTNYLAYYIGWCPDESSFDSSFDNYDSPTTLKAPIAGANLIEGWTQGVVGMNIGGVRELTIPGELAYGETQEICGTTNSPLKFVVMAIENENISKLQSELNEIYQKMSNIYYSDAESEAS